MDIISLVASILAGAITGYITNTIAVDMLFRGIGPFSGVIIKTRDDFTKNISELVERDIVNHRTIEKELSKDEFKNVFNQMISDIFNSKVYQNIGDINLGNIKGIDKTKENIGSHYRENGKERIEEILEILLSRLEVEDIVSEDQIAYLSESLLDIILRSLEHTNIVERILFGLYREFRYKKISDFVKEDLYNKFRENLKNSTNSLHIYLKDNKNLDIEDIIEKIYRDFKISDILKDIELGIKEKKLIQILGREKIENFGDELKNTLVKFLEDENSRPMIDDFILELLNIAESIDISIADILDSDIGANLEKIIEEKLAFLIEDILFWIDENREEIENLLESAIQSELNKNYDNRFKDKVKKGLYEVFFDGEFARRFDLVEKIVGSMENKADKSVLSREITGELIDFAKKNSLGDIFKIMKDTGAIGISDISLLISSNPDKYFSKFNFKLNKEISEAKIGDLLEFELVNYFEAEKKQELIEKLISKYLYREETTDIFQKRILMEVDKLYKSNIEDIIGSIDPKSESRAIKKKLTNSIYKKRDWAVERIYKTIRIATLNKPMSKILNDEIKSRLSGQIFKVLQRNMENRFIRVKKKRLKSIYEKINHSINIPKKLSNIVPLFIHKNLEDLLEGKVSDIISENLSGFSDSAIQDMVEDFMGKELKPITRFGALLGGISGFILYFVQRELGLSGFSSNMVSFIAYGFVGYLTNFIALKMIFRPYTQKKIFGFPLPLTPGIVSKEKPRFAKSMGNFVENDLLNSEKIDEILSERQSQVKEHMFEIIAKENYTILDDLLRKNVDLILDEVFDYAREKIDRDMDNIICSFTKRLEKTNLERIEDRELEARLKSKVKEIPKIYRAEILSLVGRALSQDKKIRDISPKGLIESIGKKIDGVLEEYTDRIKNFLSDDQNLSNHVKGYSNWFNDISDKNMNDLFSVNNRDKLKDILEKNANKIIYSNKSREIVVKTIENKILSQMEIDDEIGELLDGRVKRVIHANTESITELVLKRVNIVFDNEKEAIKQQTILMAKEKTKGYGILNWLLDIDTSIENIIDNLIDEEIPGFFEDHKEEYTRIIDRSISGIEKIKISELGLKLDSKAVREVVDQLYQNQVFISGIDLILGKSIDTIFELKIGRIFKILSIENIGDLVAIFKPQLEGLRKSTLEMLLREEGNLKRKILKEIGDTLDIFLGEIRVSDFSKDIDGEVIKSTVYSLIDSLLDSKVYEAGLDQFIERMGREFRDKSLEEALSLSTLNRDIISTVERLMEDEIFILEIKSIARNIFVDLLNENELIDLETKNYVTEMAIDSTISAIEDYLFDIIESLNLGEITEEQINNMDIEEIENLFNSFAKSYFRKLEAYGFIGSIFGIESGAIGIFATVVWKVNRVYSDKKNK